MRPDGDGLRATKRPAAGQVRDRIRKPERSLRNQRIIARADRILTGPLAQQRQTPWNSGSIFDARAGVTNPLSLLGLGVNRFEWPSVTD